MSVPINGERRFVAVSRWPYAAVAFGQPTTWAKAFDEAKALAEPGRNVAVYELKLARAPGALPTDSEVAGGGA